MSTDPQGKPANPDKLDRPDPDPALAEMSRALWWAAGGASHAHGAEGLRDSLHEFAAQMRIDSKVIFPPAEITLRSPSAWRARMKHRIFRLTRPVSWRYDRLLAEHAELCAALANQLMVAEAEIARLRARLGEGDGPNEHGAEAEVKPE